MRVRIPKPAAVELAARYRARAEAERRLVDFLAGIVLVKGLRLEDVTGFDDVAGELLLQPRDGDGVGAVEGGTDPVVAGVDGVQANESRRLRVAPRE